MEESTVIGVREMESRQNILKEILNNKKLKMKKM